MSYYLVLDAVILLILLLFAWRGFSRGLVLSLCGLVAVLVALAGAGFAARSASPAVADVLEPRIAAAIERRLERETEAPADSPAPGEDPLGILKDTELYRDLTDAVGDAIGEGVGRTAAAVAESVAYGILYLVSFVVILMVWTLISRGLDLVARFPGLNGINRVLGALLGLLKGCVLLFLLGWLIRLFGGPVPQEAVEQTHLFRFFMTASPLAILSLAGQELFPK